MNHQERIGQEIKFVRFGTAPADGCSFNHRDQQGEEGMSCYEIKDGKPEYCGWYFGFLERPAYVGLGRIVSFGSDGEPLVEIITIRRASKAQKEKHGWK